MVGRRVVTTQLPDGGPLSQSVRSWIAWLDDAGNLVDQGEFPTHFSQANAVAASCDGGAIVAGGDLDATAAGEEFVVTLGGFNVSATALVKGFVWDGGTGATQRGPNFAAYAGNTYGATVAIGEMGSY